MTTEDNKTIVRRFLARFSEGDVDGVLDLLADDGDWWVSGSLPGISGSYGKQALGELLRAVRSVYKRGALEIIPLEMTAEGDRVAVEATSHAELTDGRIYANRYHFLFVLSDGRIRRVKEYMDTYHAHEIFVSPSSL